ncbi:hypothetical protein CK203_103359 [Vitis vinifera]|uniref:Uncharacterized protein n=1 Tax=Vitis vinifera TaxID=29760 RepID=A0A438DMX5_VITVI|nr:hypothetical protein CK203_103359 [Vitis vinifera]
MSSSLLLMEPMVARLGGFSQLVVPLGAVNVLHHRGDHRVTVRENVLHHRGDHRVRVRSPESELSSWGARCMGVWLMWPNVTVSGIAPAVPGYIDSGSGLEFATWPLERCDGEAPCRSLANCLLSMAWRHSELSSSPLPDERLLEGVASLSVTESTKFPQTAPMLRPCVPMIHVSAKWTHAFNQDRLLVQSSLQKVHIYSIRSSVSLFNGRETFWLVMMPLGGGRAIITLRRLTEIVGGARLSEIMGGDLPSFLSFRSAGSGTWAMGKRATCPLGEIRMELIRIEMRATCHQGRVPTPWALNDEVYLTGIDRAPRPYGYWTLYGSPINWKATTNKEWSKEDLQAKPRTIEEMFE